MTDELVKGIRRIVGDREEDPTGLSDAELRKAIGISRGVAFIRSDGSISGGGGEGAGNDTSAPVVPDPEADAGDPAPGDDGKVGTGTDAGNKTVVEGDVADVDDATESNTKIGTVTGTDPTTGNITSVNFDSLAGIEYAPPDGWDAPDTPPPLSERFLYTDGTNGWWRTPTEASEQYILNSGGGTSGDFSSIVLTVNDDLGGGLFSYFMNWEKSGVPQPQIIISGSTCASGPNYSIGGDIVAICGIEGGDGSDALHPSDDVCAVAYDYSENGYKGYELDPDCSVAQQTSSTCVVIRSQTQTSRYFRYCKLTDGGTKITEVDSGGTPVPGTVSKIMDAAGNVNSFFDVALDPFYT